MIRRRSHSPSSTRRAFPAALLVLAGCASAAAPPPPAGPTVEIPALAPAPAPIEAAVDPGPIPASAADPTLGNADALVTLVIFGDLEDPFYHRAIDEARGLAQRLGPDQLRVVYKHLPGPWHKHARAAELAAEAVFHAGGAAAFWSFHDAALGAPELGDERYAQWATAAGVKAEAFHEALADALARPSLDAYAAQLGLDMRKFASALDGEAHKAEIEADQGIASRAGISGTPACLVNYYYVSGAQPLTRFSKVVKRILAGK